MTMPDTPRQYAKPTRAIANKLAANTAFRLVVATSTSGRPETGAVIDELAEICAVDAINEMRKHGWISDLGISAIRAEQAATNEHDRTDLSAKPRNSNMTEGAERQPKG